MHRTNATLIANIEKGIFDTPTRKFISKLIAIIEYNSTQIIISNYQIEIKDHILMKRREHAIEIRYVLKNKYIISIKKLYNNVKICKDATRVKKIFADRKGAKIISVEQMEIREVIEVIQRPGEYMIGGSE